MMTIAVMFEPFSTGLWEVEDCGRQNNRMVPASELGLDAELITRLEQWSTDLSGPHGERQGEAEFENEGLMIAAAVKQKTGSTFKILYVGLSPLDLQPVAYCVHADGRAEELWRGS